jgi:hypothetical protein
MTSISKALRVSKRQGQLAFSPICLRLVLFYEVAIEELLVPWFNGTVGSSPEIVAPVSPPDRGFTSGFLKQSYQA